MTLLLLARHFTSRKTASTIRHYRQKGTKTLISKNSYEDFQNTIPKLLDNVILNNKYLRVPAMADHVRKMVQYTVLGGRKVSPLLLMHMYEKCQHPDHITRESLHKCYVLAWCTEMYNSSLIAMDDMIDKSLIRREKPCWYLMPGVGTKAANDASILLGIMYQIVRQNFSGEPYYGEILNQFHESYLQQYTGQSLDCLSEFKIVDMKDFTVERYNITAECKVAQTFKVPLCLALLISNRYTPEINEQLTNVCSDIGKLYQMQNDYLEFYGNGEITGKGEIISDVAGGKCTWMAVTAFKRCNDEQRAEFIKYYGNPDLESTVHIRKLYDNLHMPEVYRENEKLLLDTIAQKFKKFPKGIPPEPLLNMIDVVLETNYLKFGDEYLHKMNSA